MTGTSESRSDGVVDVQHLTHHFGQRVALNDVSFGVQAGSIVAILGPNGGGKTTLFRILATMLRPTSGCAFIGGADVVLQAAEVRTKLGVVFQHPSLDGKLNVNENLMHHGHMYGLRGSELRGRINEALARFGLSDRMKERIDRLSGGLRRRVELAKVMLHRPSVLLLDEPSTGLDPAVRRSMFEYLGECREKGGVTTLLTTHLMEEADKCDMVAIMDQGRIVAFDAPAALKSRVGGDVVIISVPNASDFKSRMQRRFNHTAVVVDGALQVELARGHEFVPQLIEAFPGEVDSITVGKPTLEDVFLRVTGRRLQAEVDGKES